MAMIHFLCIVPTPTPFITTSTPLTAGDSGTFICDYTGLSPAVDVESSVTWTVNSSRVDTSSGDGRISTDGFSLIFSPLTTADSGNYTCSLSLTSNTDHVTILKGLQQSSEKAIAILSMSTHHSTGTAVYAFSHLLSFSPPTNCVSLSQSHRSTVCWYWPHHLLYCDTGL